MTTINPALDAKPLSWAKNIHGTTNATTVGSARKARMARQRSPERCDTVAPDQVPVLRATTREVTQSTVTTRVLSVSPLSSMRE